MNPENEDKFTVFMINLLKYYLKNVEIKSDNEDVFGNRVKNHIRDHLRELCNLHGPVFASYLKNKMIKIVEGIKLIYESPNTIDSETKTNLLE